MSFYSNLKKCISEHILVYKDFLTEIYFVSQRVMGRLQQERPLQLTCSCLMFISVLKVMGQACLGATTLYCTVSKNVCYESPEIQFTYA